MVKIVTIASFVVIGLVGCFGGKKAELGVDELLNLAQANPNDPKVHYQLAVAYARMDSADQAVSEYKTLLELNVAEASDPYLRSKIASFLELEPYALHQVTSDTAGADRCPSFAWRGSELLFESNRDGPWQIYLTDVKGGKIERITHDTIVSGQPAFAPDGSTIVYAYVTEKGWKLAIIKHGEKEPRVRFDTIPGLARSPTFSPDGREIAFQWRNEGDQDFELALLDLKTGKVRPLTDNIYWDGKPKFSADGKTIVYHSNEKLNFEIYMMDRNGNDPHPVTGSTANDYDPWFWGSDKVVFSSNRDGNFELYLLDLKNNDLLRLTNNEAEEREPTVSGDGHWLAFRSNRTGRYKIFAFDLTQPVSREELAEKLAQE